MQAIGYLWISAIGLFRGLFNPSLSCKLLYVACPGPPGSLQKESSGGQLTAHQEVEEAAEQMMCSWPWDVPNKLRRGEKQLLSLGETPVLPTLGPCGCLMKQWHRGVGLEAGVLDREG